jgi:hypothetical protein
VNAPALRAGSTAWRIGDRTASALRCIVKRIVEGGIVEVQSSTFSKEVMRLRSEDVFTDRESCRAEIKRRAALPKDQAALALPPGVTRGLGKGE